MKKFCDIVKEWRSCNGLKLKEAAEELGVSTNTVWNWEHDHHVPVWTSSLKGLWKFCERYNCGVDPGTFGIRLKKRRRQLKLTITAMSNEIGVSHYIYVNWENGRHSTDFDTMVWLWEKFDLGHVNV